QSAQNSLSFYPTLTSTQEKRHSFIAEVKRGPHSIYAAKRGNTYLKMIGYLKDIQQLGTHLGKSSLYLCAQDPKR
ncbi:hypothetical protein IRJ41_017781, partial [Triplophysa rosa]